MTQESVSFENHSTRSQAFRIGKPGFLKSIVFKPTMILLALLLFSQAAFAGQVTILSPTDDTRVDFERMGLRVDTYTTEQLENMDRSTAISVGQSIDASFLVLTGARTSSEVFASLYETDEIRVAIEDLFQRGGTLFLGPVSGGVMNRFPDRMRSYFEQQDVFLPRAGHRASTSGGIGTFTAYANPDLMDLPILSEPNSLAQGTWAGVRSNIFYWQNFPADKALPILVREDNEYPVMLLQEGIAGEGKLILSQARDLTRVARSDFWENLIAYLGVSASGDAGAGAGSAAGVRGLAAGEPSRPLMFVEAFEDVAFEDIAEADMFEDSRIWEAFETVALSVHDTGETPEKATEARLGIIGDYLVAAFHCEEPNPAGLTTDITIRDDKAWTDDAVELVVVPHEGGSLYHVILTAGGAIYDARDRNNRWDADLITHVRIDSDAWRAVIAVPLSEVFEDGAVPDTFFANLARQEQAVGEISSWMAPIHGIPSAESVGHISRVSPRELAARLVDRPAGGVRGAAGEGFEIWQASAWEDGLGLTTRPLDDAEPGTLELHMPRRGTDAAVLLVRNHEPETLVFKVNPSRELKASGGQSVPFYDVATLYRGIPRLSSYETLGFDPLEDIGNGGLLSVAPGETAMLWLDAAGAGAAGRYRGELSLLPITIRDQQPINIPIDLHIYDVEIPDPLPLQVFTWGPYTGNVWGDRVQYVELAYESHINNFRATYPLEAIQPGPTFSDDPSDYLSNLSNFWDQGLNVKFTYSYHLFTKFTRDIKEAGFEGEPMDEQWQAYFIEWFGNWMSALESEGITYDDFWIQIEDEPRTHDLPLLVPQTALLKEHFPQARTWVSIAPWSTMEDLEALQPHIDLWVPERRRITMRETAPEELAFYKEQGEYWPYLCSRQMDMQSMMTYYRHRGIQDYLLGGEGIVLWAYNSWGGDSWAQWDTPRADGSGRFDEALVYRGEHGPVPSKRLFAFRAGIEDYVLLYLMEQAKGEASGADAGRIDELKSQAETLLGSNDPAEMEQWRRAVLALLETL
ncbi:glycoside hydrolase domain-containing protein [Phycisphaerales bacterium AB-hyl4]|uniref:Glycoside hydrolase domain-containing protein n=1 Tax=Natronomicrosphaera hydrolytica TaxID=3242702 RepID=A0ABV4U6X5_9BACT